MLKGFYKVLLMLMVISMVLNIGCSSESSDNKIAYISSDVDSEYQNTFKELQLGVIFDFDLELPKADKSWVYLWVEAYSDGKAVEPFPLTQLTYGLSPKQVEEGSIGLGILHPNSKKTQIFLYSTGILTEPYSIDSNLLSQGNISTWDYAIGDVKVGLESGEEKVLAVYRQGEESLRSGYDYQDSDSINEMINEDATVILLKIKVEEKSKS